MSPTLKDGDIVITIKPRSLRPGLIYVVDHIDLGRVIKRLGDVENGRYRLSGDNAKSTPRPVMGTVEPGRIKARAIMTIGSRGIRRLR